MLKNKFKIITLVLAIILIIMPFSFAENETDKNVTNTNEALISNNTTSVDESNLKKGDLYLIEDNVTIDYMVDGNVFIIADSVNINSQIGGDVFILAKSVTVGEDAYIYSNLFVASNTLDIKGVVYDVYAITTDDITISGYIYRDVRAATENLNIFGAIRRNASVEAESVNFTHEQEGKTATGIIGGNFDYYSKTEASIPENSVTGETHFNKIEEQKAPTKTLKSYIWDLFGFICSIVLIWRISLWLTPKFQEKASIILTNKPLPVFGIGILTPIAFFVGLIALLIIGLTTTLTLSLLALFFVIMIISTSIFVISLNDIICNKLNNKVKIETKMQKALALVVTSLVYWLLTLIPILGVIISLLSVIFGTGIIIYYILFRNKSIEDIKSKKQNKEKTNTNNKEKNTDNNK